MSTRAIFFEADHARVAVARLRRDGFDADLARERLAGEDDDEDHHWAVISDAPDIVLELLVDDLDGWLDLEEPLAPSLAPLDLPIAPKRIKREDKGGLG